MPSQQPSLTDRAFQLAYKAAYRLMRAYWTVRKPNTHGALVALWNGGNVLLVRNSYVPYYSLPGGTCAATRVAATRRFVSYARRSASTHARTSSPRCSTRRAP